MKPFLLAETNFFAAAVLIIIYVNMQKGRSEYSMQQKLFGAMLLFNVLLLLLDAAAWLIDGIERVPFPVLNGLVNGLYYLINPVPCMLWSLYVDHQIHCDSKRTQKLSLYFLIPVVLNAIFTLTNPFHHLLFTINAQNLYTRGSAIMAVLLLCYAYLTGSFVQILIRLKRLERHLLVPLLVFSVLPYIAGLVQYFIHGISIIWICSAVSLLMIFLNIQNNQIFSDYMTGLYNRKQLAMYLDERIRSSGERSIAGIMLDIDNLKAINDSYGHVEGDRAIVNAAKILKKSVGQDAFVARFAGDEFIVICKDHTTRPEFFVKTIQNNVDAFNRQGKTPYKLGLSMGFDTVEITRNLTAQEFTNQIDALMFEAKARKRKKEAEKKDC